MKKVIIAAMDINGFIGKGNGLPWGHNRHDISHFRKLTTGHPVIMGRKTAESLPKPLTGRDNIVVSHGDYARDGFFTTTLAEAFDLIEEPSFQKKGINYNLAFIIGGASLYDQTIRTIADSMEITVFKKSYGGDTSFPCHEFYSGNWNLVEEKEHKYLFFRRYERT